MVPQLILGSASFIRPRLLNAIGITHIVIPSPADENEVKLEKFPDPHEFTREKAVVKAMGLAEDYPNDIIIGSDSVVVKNGTIYEKPIDEAELRRFAADFSESWHDVVSAICIIYKGEQRTAVDSMTVFFDRIDRSALDAYVKTRIWHNVSGGFGIQTPAARFIKGVDGDFYAGAGMPVRSLCLILREIGAL